LLHNVASSSSIAMADTRHRRQLVLDAIMCSMYVNKRMWDCPLSRAGDVSLRRLGPGVEEEEEQEGSE
jgi:hypothetical protein